MFLYSGGIDDELGQGASKVLFNVTLINGTVKRRSFCNTGCTDGYTSFIL